MVEDFYQAKVHPGLSSDMYFLDLTLKKLF